MDKNKKIEINISLILYYLYYLDIPNFYENKSWYNIFLINFRIKDIGIFAGMKV